METRFRTTQDCYLVVNYAQADGQECSLYPLKGAHDGNRKLQSGVNHELHKTKNGEAITFFRVLMSRPPEREYEERITNEQEV